MGTQILMIVNVVEWSLCIMVGFVQVRLGLFLKYLALDLESPLIGLAQDHR